MSQSLLDAARRIIVNLITTIDHWSVARARARLLNRELNKSDSDTRRKLLVDVSVISKHDARTGIQRVVRCMLDLLLSNPPHGLEVRLVTATRRQGYRYFKWNSVSSTQSDGGKITLQSGDVFLGLDFSAHIMPRHRRQLSEWKVGGAKLHFFVYDLLPLQYPEWFSAKLVASFRRWFKALAILADSTICISGVVEKDLTDWLERYYGIAHGAIPAKVIPLGWNITRTPVRHESTPALVKVLEQIKRQKTALMVGTLEPRKGHAQVVNAFNLLWRNGINCNLVIAGRPGWKTDLLQNQLLTHPELHNKLFWIDDADDEVLLDLYQACHGVIVASMAEGLGLPLVEAIGNGKPVLARDLPVFRQLQLPNVEYFSTMDGDTLASIIDDWFKHTCGSELNFRAVKNLPTWTDTYASVIAWIYKNGNIQRHTHIDKNQTTDRPDSNAMFRHGEQSAQSSLAVHRDIQ